MTIREGAFYPVWPTLDGLPLNKQWGEIRQNTAETKALVRNSVQELETGVEELNAVRALLGQAYGDLTFRNKFRFFYESADREILCQKNDGTVSVPSWTDVWSVRFDDGQFQVVSRGGVQSSAGFYGPGLQSISQVAETGSAADSTILNPTGIFFNADDGFGVEEISSGGNAGQPEIRFVQPFGKAEEFTKRGKVWEVSHNFGITPVLVQVMDTDRRVVIPDKADVSDPNVAHFYFASNFSGSVYVASGGIGATSLVPRDPFYLVTRTDGQTSAGRLMKPNSTLVFDERYFYVNVDLDPDAGGANKTSFISVSNTLSDPGVTLTDGSNRYTSAREINFNEDSFYLTGDLDGEPVVNLQPTFSGALVQKDSAEDLTSGVALTPVWNTASYDVGGWFGSSGDDMFTIPTGVHYVKITAQIQFEAASGGYREISIKRNGTAQISSTASRIRVLPTGTDIDIFQVMSPIVEVEPGDTITLALKQTSGGNVEAQAVSRTWFAIEKR